MGALPGQVGVAERLVRPGRPGELGQADAGVQAHLRPGQLERLGEGGHDAGGQRIGRDRRLRREHRELVPTQPGRNVVGAGQRPQPAGHLGQDRVADLAAVRVVHLGEPVQVDDEQGAGRAGAAAEREQVTHQRLPVRQAGELVQVRQAVQGALQVAALADVPHVHHQRGHLGHRTLVGDGRLGVPPELRAVPQAGADQHGRATLVLAGEHRADHRERVAGVLGVDHLAERPAQHPVVAQPEQPGRGRGLPAHGEPLVEHQGEVGGAGHQGAEVRLGDAQTSRVQPDVADHQQLPRDQDTDHDHREDDTLGVEAGRGQQVPHRGDHADRGRDREQRIAREVTIRVDRLGGRDRQAPA